MADKPKPGRKPFWIVRLLFGVLIRVLGFFTLLVLIAAFTSIPWKMFEWLSGGADPLKGDPAYIVLLGGGGIPSESGLIRSYYTAEAAARFPRAKIVVAMPGSLTDTNSSLAKMRDELVMRGVAKQRLLAEDKGRHTREQADNCLKLLHLASNQPPVLLVSSPEHVRRALRSFQKAGFTNVHGAAAFPEAVEVDLRFETPELKAKHVPDVGESLTLRYRFWDNLGLEVRCLREFAALGYYKLMGWI